jgi:hypothetical protein
MFQHARMVSSIDNLSSSTVGRTIHDFGLCFLGFAFKFPSFLPRGRVDGWMFGGGEVPWFYVLIAHGSCFPFTRIKRFTV